MTWTPAILGGEPAFPAGPPSWPPADPEVLAALERAYADGSWGRYDGPNLKGLVESLERTFGLPYAIPCCSGTVAVELALRGVGVQAGDEVLLGAYDFPGNFRSIEAIGAVPVLIDLDPMSRTIDVEQVAAACGPATKGVIASHLHGGLVDMRRLRTIADERGLAIVEDACQCPGAIVGGKPAGAWGDAGVLSFGGSKLLTAGRGGAVITARADVAQRIKVFSERGNAAFPLSELQAAVLVPQMEKLSARAEARRRSARRITDGLAAASELVSVPIAEHVDRTDFYKLGMLISSEREAGGEHGSGQAGGALRDAFAAAARAEGIALDPGFRGFLRRGDRRRRICGDCSTARCVINRTLVLHHPILTTNDATLDRAAATLVRLAKAFHDGTLRVNEISTSTKFDGR